MYDTEKCVLFGLGGRGVLVESESRECPVQFGSNPALRVATGEADPFHVVFGGITTEFGASVPDLGVFVRGSDFIALDYRMGPHWTGTAIDALLQLIADVASLAPDTVVSHEGNKLDPDGLRLLGALAEWRSANKAMHATCETHARDG